MFDTDHRDNHVFALHRYFIWSTLMKQEFEKSILGGALLPADGEPPSFVPFRFFALSAGTYMSYWYGSLFVVCEGWQELSLSDPKIDGYLSDPKLGVLKRYRNGAFHFQKDYFDSRFTEFAVERDSVPWVRDLHSSFDEWFLANTSSLKLR